MKQEKLQEMKVITKRVFIEDEKFMSVRLKGKNNRVYYGTIDYKDIESVDGCLRLKREYCGFDFCLSNSISGAIKMRERVLKINRFIKENNIDMKKEEDVKRYVAFTLTL